MLQDFTFTFNRCIHCEIYFEELTRRQPQLEIYSRAHPSQGLLTTADAQHTIMSAETFAALRRTQGEMLGKLAEEHFKHE